MTMIKGIFKIMKCSFNNKTHKEKNGYVVVQEYKL